jgi:hypothetical protein
MRPARAVIRLPIVGALLAASWPLVEHVQTRQREQTAIAMLEALAAAQHTFRLQGGGDGFATSLASLTEPCPGADRRVFDATPVDGVLIASGYRVTLRARRGASAGRIDCHGRPTAGDFVASATPRRAGIDGTRSMSVMAAGRVYVFVDPVAPAEADMTPGGLAVPLDAPVRIP